MILASKKMIISLNRLQLTRNRAIADFLDNLDPILEEGVNNEYKNFANMLLSRGKISMEFKVFREFTDEVDAFTKEMKEFLCVHAQSKRIKSLDLKFGISTGIGTIAIAVRYVFDSNYRGGVVTVENLNSTSKRTLFMDDFDLW